MTDTAHTTEREESFNALVYQVLGDARRLRLLAEQRSSQDLWPPREARRIAFELRETADAVEHIAEREPR